MSGRVVISAIDRRTAWVRDGKPWQVAYAAGGVETDRLETLIGDEYVLIDLDAVHGEEFARWDALVDSETAARIAMTVAEILRERAEIVREGGGD